MGAGAESRDSTLAEGRAALDGATRKILENQKGTQFLSRPPVRRRLYIISDTVRNAPLISYAQYGNIET